MGRAEKKKKSLHEIVACWIEHLDNKGCEFLVDIDTKDIQILVSLILSGGYKK